MLLGSEGEGRVGREGRGGGEGRGGDEKEGRKEGRKGGKTERGWAWMEQVMERLRECRRHEEYTHGKHSMRYDTTSTK